jgi:hypothetical protein
MATKDKERKELIELKNDADSNIYSSERSMREHKDSVPAEVVTGTLPPTLTTFGKDVTKGFEASRGSGLGSASAGFG